MWLKNEMNFENSNAVVFLVHCVRVPVGSKSSQLFCLCSILTGGSCKRSAIIIYFKRFSSCAVLCEERIMTLLKETDNFSGLSDV